MELDHVHELILLPYDNCVPLVFPFFPLQLDSAAMFKWRKVSWIQPHPPLDPHAHPPPPQLNNHTQIQWCYIFHTELTNKVLEGKRY